MVDKGRFGTRLLIGAATVALMCLFTTKETLSQTSSTGYAYVVPVPSGEAATGAFAMHDLPGGGVLIDALNGLFRFDAAAGRVMPVPGEAETGRVVGMHDLPGGAVLIGTENGLFRFDPAAGRVVPMPIREAVTGAFAMHDLPGG